MPTGLYPHESFDCQLIGDAMPLVRVGPMMLKGVGDNVYAFELEEV